jgi:hypothetical protein
MLAGLDSEAGAQVGGCYNARVGRKRGDRRIRRQSARQRRWWRRPKTLALVTWVSTICALISLAVPSAFWVAGQVKQREDDHRIADNRILDLIIQDDVRRSGLARAAAGIPPSDQPVRKTFPIDEEWLAAHPRSK